MVAMRYYGNVMTTTMSQYSDDVSSVTHAGCICAPVNAITTFAVEDVYTELVIDVFYIFNSTVID